LKLRANIRRGASPATVAVELQLHLNFIDKGDDDKNMAVPGKWRRLNPPIQTNPDVDNSGIPNDPTLTSMANLASKYRYQGRWDGADELEVQVWR
jgi:hypothetical protein